VLVAHQLSVRTPRAVEIAELGEMVASFLAGTWTLSAT
jgi:hypothetical protein